MSEIKPEAPPPPPPRNPNAALSEGLQRQRERLAQAWGDRP